MEYIEALVGTMLEAHDKEDERLATRATTIYIPTGTIGTTQFDLTKKDKQFLFDSGRSAALKFLREMP
jgi:NTE family protein